MQVVVAFCGGGAGAVDCREEEVGWMEGEIGGGVEEESRYESAEEADLFLSLVFVFFFTLLGGEEEEGGSIGKMIGSSGDTDVPYKGEILVCEDQHT